MARSWSKDMKLNPFTFGGSKACVVLADMMNRGAIPVREKHRVLSFITDVSRVSKELAEIKNPSLISRMKDLYRQDLYRKIDGMPYEEKFRSHLKNVIAYICRKNLEE